MGQFSCPGFSTEFEALLIHPHELHRYSFNIGMESCADGIIRIRVL